MPIAHISIPVSSLEASSAFYSSLLRPLGYTTFMRLENTAGFNTRFDGPDFWLSKCPEYKGVVGNRVHVAFKGKSQKAVREFWEAGLKAGGKDNGKPGERPQYTKGYYAAYVLDLDGNNIECTYYQPMWLSVIQIAPQAVGALLVGGVAWWIGQRGLF